MLVLYGTQGAAAPQLHDLSGDGTWCPSNASLRFGANEYPTDHYNYTRCFISGSIADHALIEVIGAESNVYIDRYARRLRCEVWAYHRGSIVSCEYDVHNYTTMLATDIIRITVTPQSYVRGGYNGAAAIANVIVKRGTRSVMTRFNEDTTFAVIRSQLQPVNVCYSGLQFYSVSPADARHVADSIYANDRHTIWQMSRGSTWAQDVRVGDWIHMSDVNLWWSYDVNRLVSTIMLGNLIYVVSRRDDGITFGTKLFDTRNCDVYDTGNIQWRGTAREAVLPSLIYADN